MGIEQLRRDLTAVADDGVQAAQEAYLKNQFRFLGVKTPCAPGGLYPVAAG